MGELVSVIMPSYNTAKFIGESIRSVLAQTYTNWELIIVDDCSTDDTDRVVAEFHDPRIRYLKNEKNSGAAVRFILQREINSTVIQEVPDDKILAVLEAKV